MPHSCAGSSRVLCGVSQSQSSVLIGLRLTAASVVRVVESQRGPTVTSMPVGCDVRPCGRSGFATGVRVSSALWGARVRAYLGQYTPIVPSEERSLEWPLGMGAVGNRLVSGRNLRDRRRSPRWHPVLRVLTQLPPRGGSDRTAGPSECSASRSSALGSPAAIQYVD